MKAPTCSRLLLGSLLLSGLILGCAVRRPAVTAVCPPIPVPARPAAPSVVLPAPDAEGRYCLSQDQVNDLARGIADLQLYTAQLEAAVTLYNEAQETPR